jgi:hypothetical protein
MLTVILTALLLPATSSEVTGLGRASVSVTAIGTSTVWDCPDLAPLPLPGSLLGYSATGCGFSGPDGAVLLPEASVFLAVPPGSEPTLSIIAEGISPLDFGEIGAVTVTPGGIDSIHAAPAADLPVSWGSISHTGVFRRVGIVRLSLHPVIVGPGGALFRADRFRITLSYANSGEPSVASRTESSVLGRLLAGGDRIWTAPPGTRAASPFWGLPWIAMEVDTAGVHALTAADLPGAVGTPSATLAVFCGRGREMGEHPWENTYTPRPVPILVLDGGDGTFDAGDSLLFFARGLSWWESDGSPTPSHFNHRFARSNIYWLTWGGEPGARMDVIDGSLTGAPAMPDSFLARSHFERNLTLTRTEEDLPVNMPDDWAWDRNSGSSSQWLYYSFDAEAALGSGWIRAHLRSPDILNHHAQFTMNGTVVCDTTWRNAEDFVIEFPTTGISPSGNTLGIRIIRGSGNETVLFDWFEVFSWTDNSIAGQAQVPLEWWGGPERARFTWAPGLTGARAFLVSGDTLAAALVLPGGSAFELEIPEDWPGAELWIVPPGSASTPVSLDERAPGRILETLSGANRIYVSADLFMSDLIQLLDGAGEALAVASTEVYDEMNGGVRDPGAIRALISHIIGTWDPIPTDVVLVGTGTWDPRNFTSTRTSFIDVLYYFGTEIVSDDQFAIVQGDSLLPQAAVSRIAASSRSDVQLLASRTAGYRDGDFPGEWQTSVIAAADDERSPLHSGDEVFHTVSMERVLGKHLPSILLPEKKYLIFYEWNEFWKKPEAREEYIEAWSEGALLSLYLGHGGYDQLADEGLLYLEDADLLECAGRLPVAIFGSCNVGQFMNPSLGCLAQAVTFSPGGGAIVSSAASCNTSGFQNEMMMSCILDFMLSDSGSSTGMCILLGKLASGYGINAAPYITFGDGSIPLAYPWTRIQAGPDSLLTGEWSLLEGTAQEQGLVLIEAFESCRTDSYYTSRQHLLIEYLSQARCFFRGGAPAGPDFSTGVFVPVDAQAGPLARTQFVYLNDHMIGAQSTYPAVIGYGSPAYGDSVGPDIEFWVDGYRDVDDPAVSGTITVRAILSDSSGINLLGGAGRQLALYTDGSPQDVSRYFRYDQGSWTTGELTVIIGSLSPGAHELELRASDGLLNRSEVLLSFTVTSSSSMSIGEVFPYPNPCDEGVSLNWSQTAPGAVDIAVFTVAGRPIVFMGNLQGEAGYNQHYWDCTDADGDPVASGSYIFLISAASVGADDQVRTRATGILAVVRGSR